MTSECEGGLTIDSIESTEDFLRSNDIAFETIRHPAAMTVEEMVQHRAEFKTEVAMAKHLFLHDKKKKDQQFWLVVAKPDEPIDLKMLAKYVSVSPGNFRGADADSLDKYLGCQKGNVNYFSIVNDKAANKVKVLYSKALLEWEWQSFHPMDNTASTCINRAGVQKIRELSGKTDSFEVVDFADLDAALVSAPTTQSAAKKKTSQKAVKQSKSDVAVAQSGVESLKLE